MRRFPGCAWRFGRVTRTAAGATAVLAIGSCAALAGFQAVVHRDLHAYGAFLPVSGWGGVIVGGAVFSLFNALCEEIVFRGIFFDALEAQWGARMAAGVTALLFGFCHLHGYPPGPLGAVLAGGYGLALGGLRVFTGGLGLPVMAHVAADATIFAIVMRSGVL